MRFPAWPVVALVVQSSAVFAEEPAQKRPTGEKTSDKQPDKTPPERVHLGATSVTVVDEHETVDDVITRLRSAKPHKTQADKAKPDENNAPGAGTSTGQGQHKDGRASLQPQRESAAAHAEAERPKDERRERAASARARIEKKQRR
jgi:hypothetical protein